MELASTRKGSFHSRFREEQLCARHVELGEMWFRSEPEGLVGWGGVEGWTGFGIAEWVGMERWGGGGGLCTEQVTVQCVVRVAAKHWVSGLQGWGGR